MAIGIASKCKVNANIGASPNASDAAEEVKKLKLAVKYGADTVMDLSTGGVNLDEVRTAIIGASPVPIGTVPVYQALESVHGSIEKLDEDDFLLIIEKHCQQGVDYQTIHAGLLIEHLPKVKGRITGIVSRGGGILAQWTLYHHRQNPLYTRFDDICEIFKRYDCTFSLGDSLRLSENFLFPHHSQSQSLLDRLDGHLTGTVTKISSRFFIPKRLISDIRYKQDLGAIAERTRDTRHSSLTSADEQYQGTSDRGRNLGCILSKHPKNYIVLQHFMTRIRAIQAQT